MPKMQKKKKKKSGNVLKFSFTEMLSKVLAWLTPFQVSKEREGYRLKERILSCLPGRIWIVVISSSFPRV